MDENVYVTPGFIFGAGFGLEVDVRHRPPLSHHHAQERTTALVGVKLYLVGFSFGVCNVVHEICVL